MHLVEIRIADAGRIALRAEKIIDGISQYYIHQYRRVKKKQETDQELAADFLLGKYLNARSDVQMVRLRHGKPMLRLGKNYFSLSHSGDYVVPVSTDIDIGVNIEQIEDIHQFTMWKVFTLGQREQLEQTMETERPELLAECRIERGVVLKLRGTGFAVDTTTANARSGSTKSENRRRHLYAHSFRCKEYMIAYAAYGEFDVSAEEDGSYLHV